MPTQKIKLAAMLMCISLALAACVQLPTEKQSIVDQRPQVSFRFDSAKLADARLIVDDLEAGTIGDFKDGKASLRVLPGTHTFKVVLGEQVLLVERAYLADGAVRPFTIR